MTLLAAVPVHLALTTEEADLWTILLVVGVVVLIAVAVLLHVLLRLVAKIDDGVAEVWQSATLVAGNTATTWQLGVTGDALEAIRDEAVRHDAMLEEAR
jgi:hypothetical protein